MWGDELQCVIALKMRFGIRLFLVILPKCYRLLLLFYEFLTIFTIVFYIKLYFVSQDDLARKTDSR